MAKLNLNRMKKIPKVNFDFRQIAQSQLVYCGFGAIFATTLIVNGFEACWISSTGQFIAATAVYPISFETTTLTASIPENDTVVATSYKPEEVKTTSSSCKVNLDGFNQIGEQTTEGGKTFLLFSSDRIVIVPKGNRDSGNVVLKTTGSSLKITACGTLSEQGLLVGKGADAPKFNLGELDNDGKPKTFTTKIKKGSAKKSEPLTLTIL
jgi:hypothetical protein